MKRIELFKRHYLFMVVTSMVCIVLFYYSSFKNETRFYEEALLLFKEVVNASSKSGRCSLPLHLNPFDPLVMSFVVKLPNRIECNKGKKKAANLTFVNDDGVLITRDDGLGLKCVYQRFDRNGTSDDQLLFDKGKVLPPKLDLFNLGIEFVNVKCLKNGQLIYENNHFYPSTIKTESSYKSETNDERVSVLVLVIESMSRLNYLRFLTKTRKAFESLGNFEYLEGLTKLADNSFPNMVPMLTGLRPYHKELPRSVNPNTGPYDDLPFLWKRLKEKGYITAFIEDDPKFTLFNYLGKGFMRKPVDWYPRPFWLQISHFLKSFNYCYNYEAKIDLFFRQISQFLYRVKSNPYFIYSFFIQATHDDFVKAQLIDSHVSNFINAHRQQLNSSLFVLMGDHGNRYGKHLQTIIGRIEERMPLFAVHLPGHLMQKAPHLKHFFNLNRQRLTGWLDVHTTLSDIASNNFSIVEDQGIKRSYSLWREMVPLNRTCEDALIPDTWCVCDEKKEISVNNSDVKRAAHVLVDKINEILLKEKNKCRKLTLFDIRSAYLVFHSSSVVKSDSKLEKRFEITVSVKPSNALFSGQVVQTHITFEQKGDISRLNQYGNQSICIKSRYLRKFCYCY